MPKAALRLARPLLLTACVAGGAAGLAALALQSSDALIAQAFQRALAAAPAGTVVAGDDAVGAAPPPAQIWLTRQDPPVPGAGAALIGERITMAVDGGAPVLLEVIAVAEIASRPGGMDGPAGERLVMVTCRELAGGSGQAGRLLRLIVDADAPMVGTTLGPAHRAL